MIDAERWYEYEQQYSKYGLDMEPKQERNRKRKSVPEAVSEPVRVHGNDRVMILAAVFFIAAALILFTALTAYGASVRYEINKVENENSQLWSDIKELKSENTTKTDVSYIEGSAAKKIGMVTAGSSSRVYISESDVPEDGFAEVLKDKAYK